MSYPGAKVQSGTFQLIIGQMPPHPVYVEAFFGSGQVFKRKRPAAQSIVIDRVAALVDVVRFNPMVMGYHGDALEILPALALPAAAVVYCDPPYLLETRQGRLYYEHELSDDDHRRLLTVLQGLNCRVMVSGYPSDLYDSTLTGWRCIRYRTRTRGRTLTECLWLNYPEPEELHDWRYAGQTYRQRLSLKRLAARWLARLETMPARKRGFLLDAIAQRQFGSRNAISGATGLQRQV